MLFSTTSRLILCGGSLSSRTTPTAVQGPCRDGSCRHRPRSMKLAIVLGPEHKKLHGACSGLERPPLLKAAVPLHLKPRRRSGEFDRTDTDLTAARIVARIE
jgi:hypothetical protein